MFYPLLKEKISRQITFMSTFFNQVASQKMLNCVKEKEMPWLMQSCHFMRVAWDVNLKAKIAHLVTCIHGKHGKGYSDP